jgi:hypothetical protein
MNLNPSARFHNKRILGAALICLAISTCVARSEEGAVRVTNGSYASDASEDETTKANTNETETHGGLEWHTNYAAAHALAKREGRMLLVNFVPKKESLERRQLDDAIEKDAALAIRLESMVLARLPQDYESDEVGVKGPLVNHPAFKYLYGRTGIVIIDLRDPDAAHYDEVVTALPFASGKYYRWRTSQLKTALELPAGSITQRTMIWAVRIHPESPASTAGSFNRTLADSAMEHSEYQARIGVQGHQGFDGRFQHVVSATHASGASEVVAESWPEENLIDSCIDCVASWRQSPGHWGAVRGRHRLFGYDIRRGSNGIWYGTGIFGD